MDYNAIPEKDRVYCQCGKAWQTKEGWAAQGLFEDVGPVKENDRWRFIEHNLAPEKCREVVENG